MTPEMCARNEMAQSSEDTIFCTIFEIANFSVRRDTNYNLFHSLPIKIIKVTLKIIGVCRENRKIRILRKH